MCLYDNFITFFILFFFQNLPRQVASVLCSGGNQIAERWGGAAITTAPAIPLMTELKCAITENSVSSVDNTLNMLLMRIKNAAKRVTKGSPFFSNNLQNGNTAIINKIVPKFGIIAI